ncbi:tetraspanin-1-like [Brachionichthys hirsutus]|uniref:tetraspanin-1-like n=1 Tax=Brachionichthys hirsutus TaxID=412623 RepID=UPI003604D55F
MCCAGFLKMMMFIFNGAIFLAGVAIMGVGIWVKVDSGSLMDILDNVDGAPSELSILVNVSYLLIGVGAVLLVIGFLGCCGAIKESKCMLLTFFSIVLIIFLLEVAAAVVLLVFQNLTDELLHGVENELRNTIRRKYGQDEDVTSLWNSTMEKFDCCGVKNYTDFYYSPFYNVTEGLVFPPTCCRANVTVGECNESEAVSSVADGCLDILVQLIEENSAIIAGVALGIAALEIAAMVVSMVLYKQIGSKA